MYPTVTPIDRRYDVFRDTLSLVRGTATSINLSDFFNKIDRNLAC